MVSAPGGLWIPSLVFQQALASGRGLPGLCQQAVLGALTSPRRWLVSCARGRAPGKGCINTTLSIILFIVKLFNVIYI